MNISEKSDRIHKILVRDFTRAELADWLLLVMTEEDMDEILSNDADNGIL